MRVIQAITQAIERLTEAGCPEPQRDAELLYMHAAGWSREVLYCNLYQEAVPACLERYWPLVERRRQREPIAYIRGVKEFFGLELELTPDVLVPRPETEIIVEEAVRLAPPRSIVADACTGSGNIAVSLAHAREDVTVLATDISLPALRVAAANARKHGVDARVRFVRGSLLECFPRCSLDMVAANPPYVASGDEAVLMEEVRRYEPAVALYAGEDGLRLVRMLIAQAAECLKPGGFLLMELGLGQGPAILDLLESAIWEDATLLRDLRDYDRTLCVRKRGG